MDPLVVGLAHPDVLLRDELGPYSRRESTPPMWSVWLWVRMM